jgi:hypothetical protein
MSGDLAAARLPLYRNPVRLAFSASLWRAVGFLLGYLGLSGVLFSVAVTFVTTAVALSFTLIGLPLAIAAAAGVHWCASMERVRLRPVFDEPVRASYAALPERGWIARAAACWRDRATWRELAYVVGMFVPFLALDTAVVAIWGWFVSWITLPLWYWAPWLDYHGRRIHGYQLGFYFPHGPDGPGTIGIFVDTLPKALLVAAAGIAGFGIFNYVLVATARMHARVARAMLSTPVDPLAEVKTVVSAPGPLGPLRQTTR